VLHLCARTHHAAAASGASIKQCGIAGRTGALKTSRAVHYVSGHAQSSRAGLAHSLGWEVRQTLRVKKHKNIKFGANDDMRGHGTKTSWAAMASLSRFRICCWRARGGNGKIKRQGERRDAIAYRKPSGINIHHRNAWRQRQAKTAEESIASIMAEVRA
jgi:hypothetical protein